MKLSENDRKALETLRKKEKNWRLQRWICVFNGILWTFLYWHYLSGFAQSSDTKELDLLDITFLAVFLPYILPPFLLSIYMGGKALYEWDGSRERKLIISLVESMSSEQEGTQDGESAAASSPPVT